jgi:ABC-2 type transport system permease protein
MIVARRRPVRRTRVAAVRALRVVWKRELIRFVRDRARMITALVQPLLFLFVLGTGMGRNFAAGPGLSYRTFLFPGILAMTVLFTAVFAAVSVVWDREFGFLREMLVAPVPRAAILLGKCAGGATVSTLQGAIVLALAGLVGVPYTPTLLVTLLVEMFLAGLMLTSIGLAIASQLRQVQSFGVVVQPVILPMFFLSGAIFPLANLPTWLGVLTRFDPLTYVVDPMRRAVFAHLRLPHVLAHTLAPGITWAGWRLPTPVDFLVVGLITLAALMIAIASFQRTE